MTSKTFILTLVTFLSFSTSLRAESSRGALRETYETFAPKEFLLDLYSANTSTKIIQTSIDKRFVGTWKTSVFKKRDTCPGQGPSGVRTKLLITNFLQATDLSDNSPLSTGEVSRSNQISFHREESTDDCLYSQLVVMKVLGSQASVRIDNRVQCKDGLSCFRLYTGNAVK